MPPRRRHRAGEAGPRPRATRALLAPGRATGRASRAVAARHGAGTHAAARPGGSRPGLRACGRGRVPPERCLLRQQRAVVPRDRSPRSPRTTCRTGARARREHRRSMTTVEWKNGDEKMPAQRIARGPVGMRCTVPSRPPSCRSIIPDPTTATAGSDRTRASTRSSHVGRAMSSASIRATYAPRASASATLSAPASPSGASFRMTRTRGSSIAASLSPVPSTEPSSTTTSSRSEMVWPSTLRTASSIVAAAFRAARITETRGGEPWATAG